MSAVSNMINHRHGLSLVVALAGAASGCGLDADESRVSTSRGALCAVAPVSGNVTPDQFVCPVCGNGICDSGETSSSCPDDCPPPTQTLVWSAWLDRDIPDGTGDWETRADFTLAQVGCSAPSQIDAKTLTGVAWQNTGEVLTVSPSVGLICRNADQPDGICQDYEVRFGCLF